MTNKQALREAAEKAGADNHTQDEWFHYLRCSYPATVLALLDELEALKELVELQRFKLERQAEDLHQAKSLESIHREKRYEAEREFSSYKERAESNTRRLAQEVCRLEDELQAAGIRINGEG